MNGGECVDPVVNIVYNKDDIFKILCNVCMQGGIFVENKNSFVFLSYSTSNRNFVEAAREHLLKLGIGCWMADYNVYPENNYAQEINDALEQCACVLLFLSKASQESPFVQREVERAVAYRKTIISMQLEDMQINSAFKYLLCECPIIPVRKIDSPGFHRAMESVGRLASTAVERDTVQKKNMAAQNKILNRLKTSSELFGLWQLDDGQLVDMRSTMFCLQHKIDSRITCSLKVVNLLTKVGQFEALSESERKEFYDEVERIGTIIDTLNSRLNGMIHRNYVQSLEYRLLEWTDENCFGCYLLVRYEPLESIWSYIAKGKYFAVDEIIRLGLEMTYVLEELHDHGSVYNHLNLDNIYVNQYSAFKLGDMALLEKLSEVLECKQLDDPRYAAPEKLRGSHDVRSDIYGLGLVMYQLANANCLPFESSPFADTENLWKRLAGLPLPQPSGVGEAMAKIILKACAYDVNERYQSVVAMRADLQQLLSSVYYTPYIIQKNWNESAAATLSMIFSYWGIHKSLDEMCYETIITPDGSRASNIMRAAKRYGINCRGFSRDTRKLENTEKPCIIYWNYNHFIVLESLQDGIAVINDPAVGHREISFAELDEGYSNIVLTFQPLENDVKETNVKNKKSFWKRGRYIRNRQK